MWVDVRKCFQCGKQGHKLPKCKTCSQAFYCTTIVSLVISPESTSLFVTFSTTDIVVAVAAAGGDNALIIILIIQPNQLELF